MAVRADKVKLYKNTYGFWVVLWRRKLINPNLPHSKFFPEVHFSEFFTFEDAAHFTIQVTA